MKETTVQELHQDVPRILLLETSPWEVLLAGAMEVALRAAHSGAAVDLVFLEDAATERRWFKAFLRQVPGLWRLLATRPERVALVKFQDFIASMPIRLVVRVIPRRQWRKASNRNANDDETSQSQHVDSPAVRDYILSSITHRARDPQCVPEDNSPVFRRELRRFKHIAQFTEQTLRSLRPDEVVVSNGRMVEQGAIVETCRKFGIPVSFHEIGGRRKTKYFWQRYSRHDFRRRGIEARRVWKSLSASDRELAVGQIKERLDHAENGGGLDPVLKAKRLRGFERSPNSCPLVVFFSSNEVEFRYSQFSPKMGFSDQYQGILELSRICRELDWDLLVRIHPNVAKTSRSERKRWDSSLGREMLIGSVFSSDSNVDSYDLLRAADLVVVWHSSMGIESVYRQIPTICLTDSAYYHAGADVMVPKTPDDLLGVLKEALSHRPEPESVFPSMHSFLNDGYEFRYLDVAAFSYRQTMHSFGRLVWRLGSS